MPSEDREEEFYDRRRSGTSYVTILGVQDDEGKPQAVFAEKVKEGEEKAVSRKNKNGDIVWERHHKGIWLSLKRVYIDKKNKFGPQLCIRGKSKTIQVAMSSDYARKFIAVCHNIDLSEPVLFEPYRFLNKDKETNKPKLSASGEKTYRTVWTLKQGGDEKENKLEDALDMSKDGDVPKWKKLKNGKWDTSDQDEFMETYLLEWVEKKGLNEEQSSVTEEEEDEEEQQADTEDADEEEEEESTPPPKKVSGKIVSTKPLKKTRPVVEEEDEEEDIP